MQADLTDSLARRLQPLPGSEGLGRTRRILRAALEHFEPSSLNELYMAVRAVTSNESDVLVVALRTIGEQDPDRPLTDFVLGA